MTVTVGSDAQGQYSFPRDRLDPGKYSVAIRAVGYELPSPESAQVEVMVEQTAALDLNLIKTKNATVMHVGQLRDPEALESIRKLRDENLCFRNQIVIRFYQTRVCGCDRYCD